MTTSLEPITSVRALARLVGRSHVTVGKWVKRDDWPFGGPPWRPTQRPAMLKWAVDFLQEDRAADARDDWSAADMEALNRECPDLLNPEELQRVADFLGKPLTTRTEVAAEVARLRAMADAFEG